MRTKTKQTERKTKAEEIQEQIDALQRQLKKVQWRSEYDKKRIEQRKRAQKPTITRQPKPEPPKAEEPKKTDTKPTGEQEPESTGYFDTYMGVQYATMPLDKSSITLDSGREQFGKFSMNMMKRMNEFSDKYQLPFYLTWKGSIDNQDIYVVHAGKQIPFKDNTLTIEFK